MPHCWEHPPPFLRGRHQPQSTPSNRRPRPGGSPRHDLHRVSPLQRGCEYSKAIVFMVRRSFCEVSKTAFISLYCALVRPHLEYTMEANAATLRADLNQLRRVQHLATWVVRGLRHVPYEERLRQLNLFSLERRRLRPDLIIAFNIFKGEVDLNPSDFFLRPPRAGI